MALSLVEEKVYPCMAAILCSGLPSLPVRWTSTLANFFHKSTYCKSDSEGEKEVGWKDASWIGEKYLILYQMFYERRFANKNRRGEVEKSEEKVLKQQREKSIKRFFEGLSGTVNSWSQSEKASVVLEECI